MWLPSFVNSVFLALIATAIAISHRPITKANGYLGEISAMIACHEALVQFGDANPGATGTIARATVDALLPPGMTDPGLFTYVIAAPGVAATYLTTPSLPQGTVIQIVQQLSAYAITAGTVSGGNIVPAPPAAPVPVIAGVPNGTIAIQTSIR
jgi:uncharacterized protein YbjT (DUF2867 family)